ncbi:N-acetylglucosamine-6-phosphate deacetylase [Pseudarthrobacter defluvii]|uniref:N-acetylglucosamine-6-phosphate deacetylase n=1 Tax=Pseudarthrobacter defluvii TaxID=410837 RepID=UPI002783AF24|nr:amidohydrolase family protein [Pseudarthrobacter defluvii]MDQ0767538.1 N-acetylglucosamine-6-phosphate deacetylase [Pseudarthrobacter defluvii]
MNNELVLRGRIVTATLEIPDGVVAVDGGLVTFAGPASEFSGVLPKAGPAGQILVPGLVDLHCHGAYGSDFSEGDLDSATRAAHYLHSHGTTTLLASVVTAKPRELITTLQVLKELTERGLVAGSHLEGPFLSRQQCGAHDPDLLLMPDADLLERLLAAAGGSLASMTLAAELPGALQLVDLLCARGIIPSLGHTAADHETAAAFLARSAAGLDSSVRGDGGIRPTVTHLFNAMPPLHHRSPGPVSASLSAARAGQAVVELIGDRVHVAPDVVKLVFDLVGAGNIALVTDAMAATGLNDGKYRLGALSVTVSDGVARLDGTGAIAGGTATLLDVVRATVAAGVPLRDAITSASAVPASVLGLSGQAGDLRAGMRADVVVLDQDLQLGGVLRGGAWVRQAG